ncbi:UNVERIFIED_CONTAM: hypothetical protein Slati_0480600 [Sesamum latifolium]|uniref:DUF4216 domain-containing protein n=1 Tax=Sesamum latifolium TaxID=2727402 RepID=A0AAW2XZC0_9LAMI
MPRRNDEHTNNDHGIQVSIFNYPVRASGAPEKRWLTGPERHIIEMYILTNCEVVAPYYDTENELLKSHYWDPSAEVTSVPCYYVNGYNFQTERHNTGKSIMNCGVCVCVKSSSYTNEDNDFYRIIEEIIQLTYPLIPDLHIVLFKCHWVDPVRGMKVHPRYHLVDVNFKKLYQKDEPFILAQQAVQVYFTQYPSLKRDKADCGTDNQTYDLCDPNGLQVMVDNQDAGTSRSQARQTDDNNEDDDEDRFEDDDTDDDEYELT